MHVLRVQTSLLSMEHVIQMDAHLVSGRIKPKASLLSIVRLTRFCTIFCTIMQSSCTTRHAKVRLLRYDECLRSRMGYEFKRLSHPKLFHTECAVTNCNDCTASLTSCDQCFPGYFLWTSPINATQLCVTNCSSSSLGSYFQNFTTMHCDCKCLYIFKSSSLI